MEYMADQGMLLATNQKMIAQPLFMVLSKMPTYGVMLIGVGMAWQMLTDENKNLIKEKIKTSGLKGYYTKFLIMENVIKYAPKMDINIPIPESIKPVLEVFGVSKEVPTGELLKELNGHVSTVIEWLSKNESIVQVAMAKMYDMLKVEKEKIQARMLNQIGKGRTKRVKKVEKKRKRKSKKRW